MKTFLPKVVNSEKKWFLIDLDGLTVGRAAIQAADILRGKNKPIFTPHLDTGDFIIAINAAKMKFSGNKENQKLYYHYSGYPGGLKVTPFSRMTKHNVTHIFSHAVRGMLPKNKLGNKMFKKLHVYPDDKHLHQAQKPELLKLAVK